MPWMFEWTVALRFLREGRMQSLLIVAGVAAGVAVVTYITALIHGLQANTVNKTLGTQAHITVRAPEDVVVPHFGKTCWATRCSAHHHCRLHQLNFECSA